MAKRNYYISSRMLTLKWQNIHFIAYFATSCNYIFIFKKTINLISPSFQLINHLSIHYPQKLSLAQSCVFLSHACFYTITTYVGIHKYYIALLGIFYFTYISKMSSYTVWACFFLTILFPLGTLAPPLILSFSTSPWLYTNNAHTKSAVSVRMCFLRYWFFFI